MFLMTTSFRRNSSMTSFRECYTECRSQGRAKLPAFPRHLARENTQLSPSLTPTLGTRAFTFSQWTEIILGAQSSTDGKSLYKVRTTYGVHLLLESSCSLL